MNDFMTDSFVTAAAKTQQGGAAKAAPAPAAGDDLELGAVLAEADAAKTEMDSRCEELSQITANSTSKGSYFESVSFWTAEPPGISSFSVYCYRTPPDPAPRGFTLLPHVVGADCRFVLLRAQFNSRYGNDEYFLYKAGGGGNGESESPPSLDGVPIPDDEDEASAPRLRMRAELVRLLGSARLLANSTDVSTPDAALQLSAAAVVARQEDIARQLGATAGDMAVAEVEICEARRLQGVARRNRGCLGGGMAMLLVDFLGVSRKAQDTCRTRLVVPP